MIRLLTILMLTASLAACSLPDTTRPELDSNAAFPNLADVPPRPTTISPYEREQMRRELIENNQAMGQ